MAKRWSSRGSKEEDYQRASRKRPSRKPKTKADLILENQGAMIGALEGVLVQGEIQMLQFEELTAKVTGVEGVVESAKVAFDGVLAELASIRGGMSDPADQAKITDLSARLSAAVDKLATAIAVNPGPFKPVVVEPVLITQEQLAADEKRAKEAKEAADKAVVDEKTAWDAAAAAVAAKAVADTEAAAAVAADAYDEADDANDALLAAQEAAEDAEAQAEFEAEAKKKADEGNFVG